MSVTGHLNMNMQICIFHSFTCSHSDVVYSVLEMHTDLVEVES